MNPFTESNAFIYKQLLEEEEAILEHEALAEFDFPFTEEELTEDFELNKNWTIEQAEEIQSIVSTFKPTISKFIGA